MSEKTTLVVCQHGLWGVKSHMGFIEKQITEVMDSKSISVLNVACNESKYTYDGVDICGKRLAAEIQDYVKYLADEERKIVTRLILIGYSLGGLMARYAIGVLGKKGFFDTVEPLLYVTFATPHLGVRREANTKFGKVYNFVTGHMLSRTGEQLQLLDSHENGRPILSILADPDREFYQYLAKFKTRRTYANVANDRTVPYWSAAMDTCNYFKDIKEVELSLDSEYSSVITAFDARHPDKERHKNKKRRIKTGSVIRLVLLLFSPILVPIFGILAFTYIGTQGLASRYRVARLLASDKSGKEMLQYDEECGHSYSDDTLTHDKNNNNKRHHHHHNDHEEDPILVDTLDAGETIPNEANADKAPQTTQQQRDTKDHRSLYNIEPSKALKTKHSAMHLAKEQFEIQMNMLQLEWERVLIYIDAMNAHASIVCRANRFVNSGGQAVVRQFVDSLILD
ncbi:putative serine esterase-domain-containing protein [Zychaea mexicana]|uniref:putative serine esterase-domain-containing protein n=1 Tax=Zychaea mexicana TaxID=64656 RepID=UPI0022FE57EC|nr:putative serine esterase-domain-containing protein [Zychaea mexicana]KAI9489448.1 putative serine esterase-domain-containing protein [Zychaea mexicana]